MSLFMMFLASNISFAVDCPNSLPQLLYRCIETVNASHNTAHAQMDVKLRSLVCMGLNEQVYIFNFAFFGPSFRKPARKVSSGEINLKNKDLYATHLLTWYSKINYQKVSIF